MKRSTKRIIEKFPNFKGKLKAYENILTVEEAMQGLTEVEAVFLRLAWFFEAPEYESFNIGLLYHHLDNEWLEFALELMTQFFQEDTYLIQKPTFSILRETPDHYFNQKQFADFLSEHGLNYDKRKLNVYYSRGKLPKADVELAGTPYWSKSTVEMFCEQEKGRLNKD
ncbi:hypothetical protein J7E63_18070 [Bacillus sp. ISL-75]|uniref:hypothetical protein n=1 Tax=Bacillus sp. ISL-75 TaxID=2819137 RepID=UPI001BE8039E|nr:hypothetical protein [Bacillus sp. ISL-75]MBT2728826.1 hypothetical protein [Bacillus sp. ISL-75]